MIRFGIRQFYSRGQSLRGTKMRKEFAAWPDFGRDEINAVNKVLRSGRFCILIVRPAKSDEG